MFLLAGLDIVYESGKSSFYASGKTYREREITTSHSAKDWHSATHHQSRTRIFSVAYAQQHHLMSHQHSFEVPPCTAIVQAKS